ncbi:GDSL-like Lipase/Acylhydrolase [Bremerella volcania]|uniref:GDSL-like Lipase/Acylhydrolase n=1 Tax=Bremerella volcania TaxID=2527984 RepID=A0A518C7T6_9BACT|nr:SGNH/GDSL hydrolase family protein [Bremerella volcania]QDU75291.1 GDSL-like Lipase/Acylhydrolase [Bremerella volcania]
MIRFLSSLSLVLVLTVMSFAADKDVPKSIAKWQGDMDKFAKKDQENPVKPGGVVFVGSSSIRMWDLDKSFPKLQAVNRGFGGSRLEDSVYYADRIILPYKPRTVVVYAGDNDVAAEYTPQQIHEDFREFVATIREELPQTKILYIAVKPSLKRWNLIQEVRETNKLIAQECAQTENCEFIDIDAPMLGEDGKPRPELFKDDGLHMTDEGYAIWTKQLEPHLKD